MSFSSSYPTPETPPKSKPRRSFWASFGLTLLLLLALCGVTGVGTVGFFYAKSPTLRSVISAVTHRDITPDRAFPGKDSITLLAIGADQDRDDYKRITGKAQRSDTLIVAHLDFATQRAALVSIPRDTKIRIPGYRGYQKINAAFAYGGTDLAKEVVNRLLGVTVDDAVVVNFDGFKKVVNLMGGVPVHVDKPLNYDDNWGDLHVHLEPGNRWLNGQQALGFVRIRKVDSDIHRVERQQQFLQAIRGRLKDPRVWFKTPAIIEAARGSLQSDLSDSQLICLASFLKGLPPDGVQTATLPGSEGPSFVTLDPAGVRQVAQNLLGVTDVPLEGLGGRARLAERWDDRTARWSDSEEDAPRPVRHHRTRTRHKSRHADSASKTASQANEESSATSSTDESASPAADHETPSAPAARTESPDSGSSSETAAPAESGTRSHRVRRSRRHHRAPSAESAPREAPATPAPDAAPSAPAESDPPV